jgi:ornithine lipid ester-linked acyl 2-hydroxylase
MAVTTSGKPGLAGLLKPKGKRALKKRIQGVFLRAEQRGAFPRMEGFVRDYAKDYPELARLEAHHRTIRRECERMMAIEDRMPTMQDLADYTNSAIHAARWKTFMFKSGRFIEANCAQAPRTAALLRRVPGLYTAFFSVLGARQHIPPHWGYWKGFLRYHLGVIIPNDNANGECWIRVNCDEAAKKDHDKSGIEQGVKYHWREGEGVLFDDTFLHEARNDADEPRVVLFLDVRRKMPLHLHALNTILLEAAHLEPSIARIRKNARVPAQSDPGRL